MKLNLLPTSVSKGKNVGRAVFFSVLMSVASIAAAIWMITSSQQDLDKAKDAALQEKPKAEQVVEVAASADTVIAMSKPFQTNISLVNAMDANISRYPDFYAKILPYIPDFFRMTSVQATPVSDKQVNLQLTGIVKDQEQYNNLVLALLRIPGATNLQRQTIGYDATILPNIQPGNLNPLPYKQSDGPIPGDPLDRLNYYISKGGVSDFAGAPGFGAGQDGRKGPMPKQNEVAIVLQVEGSLMAPQVRQVLASQGAAPPPGAPKGGTTPAPTATPAASPAAKPNSAVGASD